MNFQEMFELSRGRRKAESGKLKPLPYDQSAPLNRKVPEIMAKSEAAGVYGVPSTEGLTFIGPEGMTQDALYRHGHDLANQGNLTRPSAYQGWASSIYKELPWESTGGTYTPGRGTVTRELLIPRIESVIGQFLDFARGEADARVETSDLNEIVRAAVDRYAKANGHPVAFEATHTCPRRRTSLPTARS